MLNKLYQYYQQSLQRLIKLCNIYKICVFILTALILVTESAMAEEHTRDDVRAAYDALVSYENASPYAEKPVVSGEYFAGKLTDEAMNAALSYANFIRYLAYLEGEITLDPLYNLRAQHGAVLLAANDELAHDPSCPADMPGDFYLTAHMGTMSSNIACINWMEDPILLTAVEFFVRDDGEANLETLGHRRWILDPRMAMTGFGLANAESGLTYAVMYAHDASKTVENWDHVVWPSKGAFPADLMTDGLAWSVSLDPAMYDVSASDIRVSMTEASHGKLPLKYIKIDSSGYGAGPCVIFMPDLDAAGIEDYQQNQSWTVEITGLADKNGALAEISYTVDMISIFPIDPSSVEMDIDSAEMKAGESISIKADVIPAWADDVSLTWVSADPNVAAVENGVVTAVAPGKCVISAYTVNGRGAHCNITVN